MRAFDDQSNVFGGGFRADHVSPGVKYTSAVIKDRN